MTIDVVTGGKMASHDGRPTGGTNPTGHGETMKVSTLLSQPIDIRCLQVGMPMATQISPTPVIGKNKDYAWFFRSLSGEGKCKKATNQELIHFEFLGHKRGRNNKQTSEGGNPELACQLKPRQGNLSN